MNKPKTVRVRIAVAVDEHGKWIANGMAGAIDRHLADTASQRLRRVSDALVTVHWVEADVEIPAPVYAPPRVIEAVSVTPAEEG